MPPFPVHVSRMRQKELRIALVCYGGISLAVYMHGVTKELWKLACASRSYHAGDPPAADSQGVYRRLLEHMEQVHGVRLRVLADIVAGASAGGINGVFLAQAIHSGQSLEPLTELWLDKADVDVLLDPSAKPWSRVAKFWAAPLIWFMLKRPGNVVAESVAPETRSEVRAKLSRLIRSRWFEAPFGGLGFSHLIVDALDAMARSVPSAPLLPPGHPIDLFVTATDFRGHSESLALHSPPLVEEPEHRVSIGFRSTVGLQPGVALASPLELVFAARATASFPGAFPALEVREIDALAEERGTVWTGRQAFLQRIAPGPSATEEIDRLALIDGSVLVNAPFAEAMGVLRDRPAQREVDRRFVYIDPTPDRVGALRRTDPRPPSWFSVIFGSLSSIPREQPIRDNLEALAAQSREMARLQAVVAALRPEVEEAVEREFGHTLFLDRPTVKRLGAWRDRAHEAARKQAGFAYHGYVELKFAGIVEMLAALAASAAPTLRQEVVAGHLLDHLRRQGLARLVSPRGVINPQTVEFFKVHDLSFRIRRLRLLARRLSEEWDNDPAVTREARFAARDAVYRALSLYFEREAAAALGADFVECCTRVADDPGAVLELVSRRRQLPATDLVVDAVLAEAMAAMPQPLRRKVLLTYLGFPYFDAVTLPLLRGEGLTEFDPVKVDRISPDDCSAIRPGGTRATLRGVEFYNFGAFFSRAYRENDYLWGRLHGAERMIDLVASAVVDEAEPDPAVITRFKREAFLAILAEEEPRLKADRGLVAGIRAEVEERMGTGADAGVPPSTGSG